MIRPASADWTAREIVSTIAAVVGVALASWAFVLANRADDRAVEAQNDLREYVAIRTADASKQADENALGSYLGCKRANTQIRPGARITTNVLADLIDTVVAVPRGQELPPSFANAPRRLRRAITLLADQPYERLYADGYAVFRSSRGNP